MVCVDCFVFALQIRSFDAATRLGNPCAAELLACNNSELSRPQ
jgi:hypothetical protein